ncbi:MAG: cytochrome c biogenesis protein ResB [Tissierellaceae bacterium]
MIKRIGRFLISFRFAIVLFIAIATYSIIGTVIPQGVSPQFYMERYQTFGNIMMILQFNKVYSSLIYRILLLLFLINLTGCTLNLLPSQLKRTKDSYFPSPRRDSENLWAKGQDIGAFRQGLVKRNFKIYDTETGFKAAKNRLGVLGPAITHLGIIVIILGSFLGNLFAYEGFVNLMPGETKTFAEEGFSIQLEDFYLGFRDDGSTEQYYSDLKLIEDGSQVDFKKIWVNNPLDYKGLSIYQSSFGWVSNFKIKDAEGRELDEGILKNNEQHFYQPKHLTIYLYGFYPDFSIDQMGQPMTASHQLKHPHYAVVLYEFGNYIDSYITEPGQAIIYEDIEITFEDSFLYTGLIYRKDFGYYFVLIGVFFLFLGLLLSFYFYPRFLLVEEESILPITRQNIWGYTLQIKKLLQTNDELKKEEV